MFLFEEKTNANMTQGGKLHKDILSVEPYESGKHPTGVRATIRNYTAKSHSKLIKCYYIGDVGKLQKHISSHKVSFRDTLGTQLTVINFEYSYIIT